MYQNRVRLQTSMIWAVDIICLIFSISVAFALRFKVFLGNVSHGDQIWQVVLMCLLYTAVNICFNFNKRFFQRGSLDELFSIVQQQILFSISWIVFLYLMHRTDELSRKVFMYFFPLNIALTYGARQLLKIYLIKIYKKSKYSSRVLLILDTENAEEVINNLTFYNEWDRVIKGIVLIDQMAEGQSIGSFPVVADSKNMLQYVIHNDIDEVFFYVSGIREKAEIRDWIHELELMGIIVDINIDIFDLESNGKKTLNRVGKYAVVTFARNLFTTREMAAKRIMDFSGALIGMVLFAVAYVCFAPLIKLESPGPVLFKQIRVGKNGRRFTFYKFRSMYMDAEERKKDLLDQTETDGMMFKMKNDPRITRIGRFIRKTSIDELPQFLNVLKGDMSLVGTRPPTIDEFERYEAKHKCRLSMTPGLTGLWQISGRSDITNFEDVVKLDMEYIDNWSIWLDIKIILKTVGVVMLGKGSR